MIVIDGRDCILGRVASFAAKEALKGEEVIIVNAEKLFITGDLDMIVQKWMDRRNLKDAAKPEKSPKYPRRPDQFVRRVIRGMLPWRSKRGREAFKRIKTFIGIPYQYKDVEKIRLFEKRPLNKGATVEQICERLGW